ncbi:MAG: hypothetical protein K2J67_01640 [Lachnospiraceae bacterium]|nr:hypothetical protein [Lachnospiraceae bacterium]
MRAIMMTGKLRDRFKINTSTPNWMEYLMYSLLAFGMMLTYKYWDGKSMTVWSTVLLDCTFDGRLYDFYEVIHQNLHEAPHEYCGYNYLMLIPWAVWNIPIWILQRFAGLRAVDHTLMMVWSQMFLVFLLGVIVLYSRKIMDFFGVDHDTKSWSSYLIITCPFTFLGVFISGQSDLVVITTSVMAIYYLLQKKRIVFLLLMAFSISAKPFYIFALIAVILLVEKNVIKIVLQLGSSIIPMVLFDLIYKNAPVYQESIRTGTSSSIIENTIANGISATGGSASFVIMGLIAIYFIAYCIRYDKEDVRKKQYIIYMMVAPMAVYFAFSNYEFYRRIYLIPFLVILMAIHHTFWTINLILEKVLSICGVFLSLFGAFTAYLPCINEGVMRRLGLEQDISKCRYPSISHLMGAKLGESCITIQTIGISVFVAVTGLLLLINFPWIARRMPLPEYKCHRAVYWIDTAFMAIVAAVLFLCYFNVF